MFTKGTTMFALLKRSIVMNKKITLFLLTALASTSIYAQEQVLMRVNDRPVTKAEFEYLYKKNNSSSLQPLDEYLHLFTDYKLKVEEALTQGLDTTKTFLTEYNNYKKQLAQPYLHDTISSPILAKKIYDRIGEDIEVSHILIRIPNDRAVLPKDTLDAYEKAISVRNQLFGKKPKTFENLAKEYSEDQGANQAKRPGYLGWATSMMFVAPFEHGMYETKIGEVSMPVRSMFGYHLIKVHNRRPNPGKFNVSHIMFTFPQQESTQQQLDSVKKVANDVYAKLKTGSDYTELCKEYSTDRGSAENGGVLGWVQTGARIPQSFLDAVFSLKDAGDFTAPVETEFGFHIIKLNEWADRESWNESKDGIIRQLESSDFIEELSMLKKNVLLNKGINFKIEQSIYNELLTMANAYFPLDSISMDVTSKDNRTLLTVGNKTYKVSDFTNYMQKNGNFRYNISTDFLSKSFDNYILVNLGEAYDSSLEDRYPEYRNLLREYHDGILLFNVMNQEVWEKSANDTIGLTNYFRTNKNNYKWNAPHYKGRIIYCKDEATLVAAKKIVSKNKNKPDLDIILRSSLNNDSVNVVSIKKGVWAKGDNQFIDAGGFKVKIEPEPIANYPLYFLQGKQIKAPEEYTDVKGLVVSDYQELMEKEWMQQLRNKYKVEVNQNILETIK